MNALMTIQVRVLSAQALAQLKALEAQEVKVAASTRAVGTAAAWGIGPMAKWGSQVQWMGRQLTYNFAIPIALAMGLATKFALENEKAMVRVTKVYGDGSAAFRELSQTEIPALGNAFEQLSNQFAVHQDEVIGIAGDWAAAGASGIALAKVVKLTLETMVLGELEAADATRSLIAIQAQYGMNTKQLAKTIDILNMVENQTGATMGDLITGLSKAAGVAKTAGIDVEHLSAMMAALVPATGSAAAAGNGLKTIISRLFATTKDAIEVMHLMGVEVETTAWQSLNGTQRIEAMAKAYDGLSSSQKAQVASIIASRYQFNRFSVLMSAINNQNSYYNKSLKATADRQKIYNQRQYELNQVLTSSPQKLSQVWNILRNAMADVIVPIIPLIVYVGQVIARMGHAFSEVDPRIQKLVLAVGAFIIVLAISTKLLGATTTLIYVLSVAVHFLAVAFIKTAKFIVVPFVKALGFLIEIMYAMVAAVAKGMIRIAAVTVAWALNMARIMLVSAGQWILIESGAWTAIIGIAETAWAFMAGVFSGGASVLLAIWGAWLGEMWAGFAIWRAGMLAAIGGWLMTVGTMFTFLGSFIAEALATLWAWLTVPGLLSGAILGMWGALMAGMGRLWGALQVFMLRVWTLMNEGLVAISVAMGRGLAAIWAGLEILWNTVLVNMRFLWAAMWATVEAITAVSVTIVAGIVASLPEIIAAAWAGLAAILTSPWTLAIAAIIGIAYAFQDEIVHAFHATISGIQNTLSGPLQAIGGWFADLAQLISDAFWSLPDSVTGAMVAVLTVIRDAALQIYEWMSYLNPWATHSPSLVDSVTTGMDAIENQYGRISGIGALFANAAADLAKFKGMMPKGGEFASERADVAKNVPKALPLFDKLVGHLNKLNAVLKRQENAVNAQQAVVDRWKAALDRANAVLDRQQDKLDKLKGKLTALQDQYDAAKSIMESFADAPIQGMRAMSDAMFDNEIAQKRLQLQMMQWEQVNGSIDSIRDRFAALQGEIEDLTGKAEALRQGGAGSEILNPIYAQIQALEDQANALKGAADSAPINQMQAQMEQLQKEGQMLQLQYDINYDPLTRQIDQLAHAQQELSYDEIVAGIKAQQAAMAQLQPQIDAQNAAVATQQAYVDQLTKDRDNLQQVYDRENKKLDALNAAYSKTKDLISDIEGALRDMASAANDAANALEEAKKKSGGAGGAGGSMSDAMKTFKAGAGANFPGIGGKNAISREGGLEDQSALIDQFTQDSLNEMNDIFGGFDMLGPIKSAWNKAWGWVEKNLGPVGAKIKAGVDKIFQGAGAGLGGAGDSSFVKTLKEIANVIGDIFSTLGGWIKKFWKLVGPDIEKIGGVIRDTFIDAWHELGPELVKFAPVLKDLGKAFQNIWIAIKPVVQVIGSALLFVIKLLISIIANTLGPVLHAMIEIFKYVLIVIRGVFEVIIGLLSGDWALAWQGAKDILVGTLGVIWETIKGVFWTIWGFIKGIVEGIWGFFKWLYDALVGHSIIPDLIEDIWKYFKKLADLGQWVWDHVLKPVWDFFKTAWTKVSGELALWWAAIKLEWAALKFLGQWIWDNVLSPVWNKIKDLWTVYVKPELTDWWNRVKNVWDDLTKAATWIKNNVMDPVFEAFKTGWNKVSGWFTDNAGTILGPIKSVVRGIVTAINWMIKGLNQLDKLPGVSISIAEITLPDTFAKGGIPRRRVGNGFMTSGARAIVGEGKANYPEFVIPTDPTYRDRARGLLQMAASKIGPPTNAKGVWGEYNRMNIAQIIKDNPAGREYGIGGFLGDVAGAVAGEALDLGESAINLGKDAMNKIMEPMFKLARSAAGKIQWQTGEDAADGAIDLVQAWMKGANEAFQNELATAIANSKNGKLQKGLDFARSQAGKPYKMVYDAVGPGYYDCSGFMSAVTRAILGQNPHEPRIGTTGNFPWSMYGPVSAASKDAMSIGSTPNYGGSGTGHMAGTLLGVNIEANGDQGVVIGGRGAFSDGNFGIHAQLMLANGGIVRKRSGGVLARLGEGGHDELVKPLPHNWRTDAFSGSDSKGDRTINIYGNLEFPNITSGDDAKTFIDNLESLVKD